MGVTITKPEYQGKELEGFLTDIFFKKNVVDRFTLLPGVKDKFELNFLNFDGAVLGPDNCDFNANVNADLTEKKLVIETYAIGFEECVQTFEQSYMAAKLQAGANKAQMPKDFQSWMMKHLPLKIAAELERKAFTEIETELAADPLVTPLVINPITSLNAIEEVGKVYLAIDENLLGDPDLVIMMNTKTWRYYQQAAFDSSVPEIMTDGIKMTYLGIELVAAPSFNAVRGGGLNDNVLIAGLMKNFVRATDLVSDESELKFIDMSKTTGDDKIRVKGRLKFKCTYGKASEIVYATA